MNLKVSNIFLDSNGTIKIVDLGIEALLGFSKPDANAFMFSAPELV